MITKEQCAAARYLLGGETWTQRHLAKVAGLGESTVRNFEKGRAVPSAPSLEAIARALEAAGVVFVPENGAGAGVRLSKRTHAPTAKAKPKAKAKAKARGK